MRHPVEMVRPTKIAPELEEMILVRVRDQTACQADLQVGVIRADGKSDAFSEFDRQGKPPALSGACAARGQRASHSVRFGGMNSGNDHDPTPGMLGFSFQASPASICSIDLMIAAR
jgi:hypothetical protein